MKLNKHYWSRYVKFVLARINRPKPDCYTESHHIWPRCLGGLRGLCVDLTGREHFIAHWILSKCFEDTYTKSKMLSAFGAMTMKEAKQLNSRQFNRCRQAIIGENHYRWGKHMPEEVKQKVSASMKGEKNHFYGKKHTDEARAKMSEKLRGENHPCYGKKLPPEWLKSLSEANKDKTIYKLTHKDGREIIGTRDSFIGLVFSYRSFCDLKNGRKQSVKGWSLSLAKPMCLN